MLDHWRRPTGFAGDFLYPSLKSFVVFASVKPKFIWTRLDDVQNNRPGSLNFGI